MPNTLPDAQPLSGQEEAAPKYWVSRTKLCHYCVKRLLLQGLIRFFTAWRVGEGMEGCSTHSPCPPSHRPGDPSIPPSLFSSERHEN